MGEKDSVLKIRKTDASVILSFVVPEENPGQKFTKYEASIENAAGAKVWTSGFNNERLSHAKKEYRADPKGFPAGEYIFRLSGFAEEGAGEIVQKTTFKVVRSEN
jgi:hypothetical protein